jgi:hypothetical protein
MAQTAVHLVDHVIPNVPVRQWVLSLPIPLRFLLAAHPHLLTPVLQVIHRAISTFLIKQAGLKRRDTQTGAITLIQRFGSAANLNIHLHCLVLDGVYRIQNGMPEFHGVRTPTAEQLQSLLSQIIKRIMKALTRHGALIEEEGMTYLAEIETDDAFTIGSLHLPDCARSPGGTKSADTENCAHTKCATTARQKILRQCTWL